MFHPDWPNAAHPLQIASNTQDKELRAISILDTFVCRRLTGLSFFCEDEDVTKQAYIRGAKSTPPYDVVVLYDVLDHSQNPVEDLLKVESLSNSNTKIYVRCHPWCSPHGTHLFQLNKAYAHLVYPELGGKFTQKIIHPIPTYRKWFSDAGFSIVTHKETCCDVPKFFESPEIADKIKVHWKDSPDPKLRSGELFPTQSMCQVFRDYVLSSNRF